jgi:outer membrane scaffolding protein for murein synthesis (MipA/OmpV family)
MLPARLRLPSAGLLLAVFAAGLHAPLHAQTALPAKDAAATPEDGSGSRKLFGIEGLEGIGLGAGVVHFPAYRGAKTTKTMVLPVPYLHYEGDFFKSDKYGMRGELFNNDRIELSISASLSPPTRGDVPERIGMPNLKPTVELGPQLDFTLIDGKTHPVNLRLRLPVRQAFTVERSPKNAGVVFSPNLNLDVPLGQWNLGMVTGPIFASRKQHAYFYDVAPEYASTSGPAYQAGAGYSGSQLLFSLSRKYRNLWFGSYIRYDSLHGAKFADSPLVAQKRYVTGGVALIGIYD